MDAAKALSVWNTIYVAALAITVIATVFVNLYSRRIGAESDAKIAAANARAAQANASAATAVEGEKQLELAVEQARVRQRELEVAAEELKHQNLELQSQVEREQVERLKLQERVAPRRLTQTQKETLRKTLAKLPSNSVKIVVFIGTDDGMPFSLDLIEAINAGGWKAEHSGQTTIGGNIRGVALLVRDVSKAPPHTEMIQNALKKIGIDAPGVNDPSQAEDAVVIFIAPKN